ETDEAILLKLNIGVATILRNDIENIEKSLKEENEELEDRWRDVSKEIKKETDETKEKFNLIKSKETKVSEDEEIKSTQAEEKPKPSESPKKESPLGSIPKISIKDRRIYVNDSLYYIKGVAYGINYPECPGGMRGYEKISPSIFKKDFKMMEEAGVNTIRTYEPIPDELLDLAYKHNIMVIENIIYPHSATLFDSDEELANLIDKAKEVVKDGKDHPAILMWSIWNDAPFTWGRKGNAVKRFGFEKVNNFLKE
ncbi:unnamed protein product, partial [marine sediment metagenome]